jgi:uncharacterized protein YjbI with pentapeptide repeats
MMPVPPPRRGWSTGIGWALLLLAVLTMVLGSDGSAMAQACAQLDSGQSFAGQSLANYNFSASPPGSLRNANFRNADLRGAMFAGQDLSCADFRGANLSISPEGNPADLSATTLNGASFASTSANSTKLFGTDLTFAQMTCVDFSNASLAGARFGPIQTINPGQNCRTLMVNATLNAAEIQPALWGEIDFTNAVFLNLQAFTLQGQNLQNAILTGVYLVGVDFSGANLTGANLANAILTKASFVGAALNGVVMTGAQLKYADFSCSVFYGSLPSGSTCTPPPPTSANPNVPANLAQAVLTGAILDSAVLNQVNLAGADLRETSFQSASLAGATLSSPPQLALVSGADFSAADFTAAQLNNVDFQDTNLTGAIFNNVTIQGTIFSTVIMPGAQFSGATLKGIKFTNAILEGAKFKNATLQTDGSGVPVDFGCAQLGGTDFTNAHFSAPPSAAYVANFQSAIMPGAGDGCCPDPSQPSGYSCGFVPQTASDYGAVVLPKMTSPVMCPNATISCTGTNTNCACPTWRFSSNNWMTTACNAQQQVEVMWTPPSCGNDHGKYVNFKDSNLETCIAQSLKNNQTQVPVATAHKIGQVNCPRRGITDLTGLENFWALERLDLNGNALTQFNLRSNDPNSSGQNLPGSYSNLYSLQLAGNKLTSANLTYFPSLVVIDLSNNSLSTVVLSANDNPAALDLSFNQLQVFDLPSQTSLTTVNLSNNQLTNVLGNPASNLQSLTTLQSLDVSNNQLPSIGPITNLLTSNAALQTLYVGCNPTFQCITLGVPQQPSNSLIQSSQCVQLQSAGWVLRTTPACPLGLALAKPKGPHALGAPSLLPTEIRGTAR